MITCALIFPCIYQFFPCCFCSTVLQCLLEVIKLINTILPNSVNYSSLATSSARQQLADECAEQRQSQPVAIAFNVKDGGANQGRSLMQLCTPWYSIGSRPQRVEQKPVSDIDEFDRYRAPSLPLAVKAVDAVDGRCYRSNGSTCEGEATLDGERRGGGVAGAGAVRAARTRLSACCSPSGRPRR